MTIARIRGRSFDIETDVATSVRLGRIPQRFTTPEEAVAAVLRVARLRSRRRNRDLPGSPDFANRTRRFAVFVHGCFWHHHQGCKRATIPKRNREFWLAKFADNARRDRTAINRLRRSGYSVVVLWECETTNVSTIARRLKKLQSAAGGRAKG